MNTVLLFFQIASWNWPRDATANLQEFLCYSSLKFPGNTWDDFHPIWRIHSDLITLSSQDVQSLSLLSFSNESNLMKRSQQNEFKNNRIPWTWSIQIWNDISCLRPSFQLHLCIRMPIWSRRQSLASKYEKYFVNFLDQQFCLVAPVPWRPHRSTCPCQLSALIVHWARNQPNSKTGRIWK